MPNAIYSGTGEYDASTLMATYSAYLPALPDPKSTYEFKTGTIYNISCAQYPNRILIFMRVKDGDNTDLSAYTSDGNTNNTPTTLMFSLSSSFVVDINSSCSKLVLNQDINVILFHDQYFDVSYVDKNLFCQPASAFAISPASAGSSSNLEAPLMIVPKKGGPGVLKIKNLKL